MASALPIVLALVLAVGFLAGCANPDPRTLSVPQETSSTAEEETTGTAQGDNATEESSVNGTAANDQAEPDVERRSVRVYSSRGWFVGTEPAHPVEDGPLVDSLMVREDMFLVPPSTVGLEVSPNFGMGAYSGGIEIVHESGLVVYRQEYLVAADNIVLTGCVFSRCAVHVGEDFWAADNAPPGNYSLVYRFVGAVWGAVTVDAIVEIDAAAGLRDA